MVRLLVILTLMTNGFNAAAMARGTSPDCMSMMQADQSATAPIKAPDTKNKCPFAALCAAAGYYVAPQPDFAVALFNFVKTKSVTANDRTADSLVPMPPARPPRA